MEPFDATLRFLGEVRRACARVSRGEVLFSAVIVLAFAALIGLSLAALLGVGPGRWAWILLFGGVVASGWLVWRFGVAPGRARSNDAELALWIEKRVPDLRSSLVTAVQTAGAARAATGARVGDRSSPGHTDQPKHPNHPNHPNHIDQIDSRNAGRPTQASLGFSPELAREAAELAANVVSKVNPKALVDRTRLEKLQWGALGSVLGISLVGFLAPDLYGSGFHSLTTAPDPTHEGDDRLIDVAVSQLDIDVKPPNYTGLKARRLPRSVGDLEALQGSEVKFSAMTLFPARGAALVLESDPDARWMLELESDGTVRGSFQVGRADRYQFVLLGQDGEVMRERSWREVRIKPDAPPEALLLLPDNDLEVKPDDQIGFFYEASDDLGLDRVELVIADAEGMELSRKVVAQPQGNRLEKSNTLVEVAKLGLDPGDAVDVYFEVFDLNDISGPGRGKSQARRLSLYSPEDEHDRILQSLRDLIEKMLDVLAERLESPVDKDRADMVAGFADLHMAIAQATEALIDSMEGLIQSLSTDPLAKDELRAAMREVRDRMLTVHQQETAQLDKWANDRDLVEPRVFTTLLSQGNDESIVELESAILRLKNLIDGALKDAILEAGREMLDTQNEMMELLKQLKDNNDPAAREAAMKKLKKLQEKLRELQQKLAKLQERSPYENQNPAQRTSERQQEAMDMESQMEKIQKLLEEGKVDEAMALLEELAKSTQEMMAGLQEDLENVGGGSGNSETRREMQEVQQQLDELADGQRGLQRETGEAESGIEERQRQELMEKAGKQLEEMRGEAGKIREALKNANQSGLPSEDKAALAQLEDAAKKLEKALEDARMGEAQGKAGEVGQGAGSLQSEVGESAAREVEDGRLSQLKEAMKQLGEAKERAEKLAEKMNGMQPGQGEGLSPGEQQKLSELGESQQKLGERLQQLREKVKQMDQKMPGLEESMRESLEEAGQSMGEAKDQLSEKRPEDAQQRQQEAIEKLQEAKKNLDERMQQDQQKNGESDQPGVNDPNAKVGIPKDDPNARARMLREEIIRAMQERAPEQYKEVIRKFYEELTK